MLKKISQLGLLSAVILGLANFPSQAQTTTGQTSNQTASISGNNNQIIQVINQTVINRSGRGNRSGNGNGNGNSWKDKKDRGNDNSFPRGNSENRRNDGKREHHDDD